MYTAVYCNSWNVHSSILQQLKCTQQLYYNSWNVHSIILQQLKCTQHYTATAEMYTALYYNSWNVHSIILQQLKCTQQLYYNSWNVHSIIPQQLKSTQQYTAIFVIIFLDCNLFLLDYWDANPTTLIYVCHVMFIFSEALFYDTCVWDLLHYSGKPLSPGDYL